MQYLYDINVIKDQVSWISREKFVSVVFSSQRHLYCTKFNYSCDSTFSSFLLDYCEYLHLARMMKWWPEWITGGFEPYFLVDCVRKVASFLDEWVTLVYSWCYDTLSGITVCSDQNCASSWRTRLPRGFVTHSSRPAWDSHCVGIVIESTRQTAFDSVKPHMRPTFLWYYPLMEPYMV